MLNKPEAAVQTAHSSFCDGRDHCNPGNVHKNSLQKDFCNTVSDLTSARKRRVETEGPVNIFSSFP